MRTCLMLSGGLGYECLKHFPADYPLVCVFTDKQSAGIIEWCASHQVPCFAGNPRNGKAATFIADKEVDILFSINYLFIVEQDLLKWPLRYCFNIHGSLLPRYRGRTPHVWAVINNEKETGATVHLMEDGCDTGDIVLQRSFPIAETMTGADILKEFTRLYPEMIRETLSSAKQGAVRPVPQEHSKATYYGKRTPDDGEINWQWQKERIYNWVRAQARPYPGAFSYYNNSRVTIHQVTFDEHGYDYSLPNGTILSVTEGQPVVKTPNGALRIVAFEAEPGTSFTKDQSFICRTSE